MIDIISRIDIADGLDEIIAARSQNLPKDWSNNPRAMDRFVRAVQEKRPSKEAYNNTIEAVISEMEEETYGPRQHDIINRLPDQMKERAKQEKCKQCHGGLVEIIKVEEGIHTGTIQCWCGCSKAKSSSLYEFAAYMKWDELSLLRNKYPDKYLLPSDERIVKIMHDSILDRGDKYGLAKALVEGDYNVVEQFKAYNPELDDGCPF